MGISEKEQAISKKLRLENPSIVEDGVVDE